MSKARPKPKLVKLDMKTLAQSVALRQLGLYKLTKADVANIEVALRLRVEACEENDDHKEAALWKRTWAKFL